ncbi:MAG: universal stress protein [Algoriphagus sp.]|nr:universal stress protein [Algoriphagus sp.]
MKTIVVPFDFSSYSVAALKTAQKISAKSGAKIVCITVIPSEIDWDLLSEEAKKKHPELLEEKQEAMDVLPEYISAIAPAKAPIETIFRIGVPNELILRVIDESNADLVVLGAYGKGYVEGKFIGSTLQKVLRKAKCPVLAVKHALDGNDFRKIAFASLFDEGAKLAFDKVKPLLKLFKPSIHLLFVNTPTNFIQSKLAEDGIVKFKKGNEEINFHQEIYNHNDVENGIIEFANSQKINWVTLVSGHHETSPSYQIGTTETVLFKSELAVLSVKV